jgi:hypothetical protein
MLNFPAEKQWYRTHHDLPTCKLRAMFLCSKTPVNVRTSTKVHCLYPVKICVMMTAVSAHSSSSVLQWLSCLPLNPRFAGSNPPEGDEFWRRYKFAAWLPSEGKTSRRPHVVRFYVMSNIPEEYDRDISLTKLTDICLQVLPTSLQGVSTGYCQRALVDESGLIRAQVGMHNRSDCGRSVWDALYDTTP